MNPSTAPLLVTDDASLEAELRRLAAAAGTALDVVAEAFDARTRWSSAPVVLLGPDCLPALTEIAPGRRGDVHVVTHGPVPDHLFRAALAVGAESVVELPAAEVWLVETLADSVDGSSAHAAVVAVTGGCGGAGATTFAAALAVAAAAQPRSDAPGSGPPPVTLVDADPLGPGIERVVGLDDLDGARWGQLHESAGRLSSRALRVSLPQRDGLAVLGWGPGGRTSLEPEVVREVVSAARRGSALVVVDLPRHHAPAVEELIHRCDHLVVVTQTSLLAVASAAQVVGGLLPLVPQAHLVTRGPAAGLDPDEVAAAFRIPLAAAMGDQRRLAESLELGLGPLHSRRGPLARAARETLARVRTPDLPGTGVAA
jgi:secretion/DNA translocation related CpaE-like protein